MVIRTLYKLALDINKADIQKTGTKKPTIVGFFDLALR
jgi:hypothetical protein